MAIKGKLNSDIATEEIFEAISMLKLGKSPGTDGLTAMFFKLNKLQITPYLEQVMNDAMNGQEIP